MKKLLAVILLSLFAYNAAYAQSTDNLNISSYVSNTATVADTASSTLTLGDATHFTFVCGFTVSGLGATSATPVVVTIGPFASTTGAPVSPAFSYVFVLGAAAINTPLQQNFTPCIPAGGIATLTVPGAAGNTTTTLSMWGYKQ